jgi:hypothetical protein
VTTTIDFATVTNSISHLSISGVAVKDINELSDALGTLAGGGILSPIPDNFITGYRAVPVDTSYQQQNVYYTLNFRYYHCPIGGGMNGLFSAYAGLIANLALILKAFCSSVTLSGAMTNGAPQVLRVGPVQDAAGNQYHGADIAINIMQFLEA